MYRVTCGDVGANLEDAEIYLESVLCTNTIRESVGLLDEADVLLEEKTQKDMRRNVPVWIFSESLDTARYIIFSWQHQHDQA